MMKMPKVQQCEASECAYNNQNACHALAITVGDGTHPRCDTFCESSKHGGDDGSTGQVGACKVDICKFNQALECSAPSITVKHHDGNCADCSTFQKR